MPRPSGKMGRTRVLGHAIRPRQARPFANVQVIGATSMQGAQNRRYNDKIREIYLAL